MLKFVGTDIVFQEFPDEVTLAINISNCPCRCPSCHSPFLWKDTGTELTEASIDQLINEAGSQITCIGFMGGDSAPERVNQLAGHIRKNHPDRKIGWYTGRTTISPLISRSRFDYIKVGPYIRHLGALNSPTTNQRMYRFHPDGSFDDITHRFQINST